MKLPKLLRGAPAVPEAQPRRRRRAARPDGPRTIIPVDDATPAQRSPAEPRDPFSISVDAARERLRREIPPVADELE